MSFLASGRGEAVISHITSHNFTYCAVRFPGQLSLRLSLRSPKALFSGSGHSAIGVVELDALFDAVCDDVPLLRATVLSDLPSSSSRNLADDLVLARREFPAVAVSDSEVRVETTGHIADEAVMRRMLESCSYLAGRFQQAIGKALTGRHDDPRPHW